MHPKTSKFLDAVIEGWEDKEAEDGVIIIREVSYNSTAIFLGSRDNINNLNCLIEMSQDIQSDPSIPAKEKSYIAEIKIQAPFECYILEYFDAEDYFPSGGSEIHVSADTLNEFATILEDTDYIRYDYSKYSLMHSGAVYFSCIDHYSGELYDINIGKNFSDILSKPMENLVEQEDEKTFPS